MERVNIDTKRTGILDYNYNNVYYEVGIISKGVASSDPCPSRKKMLTNYIYTIYTDAYFAKYVRTVVGYRCR